jgi:hypothetical protein
MEVFEDDDEEIMSVSSESDDEPDVQYSAIIIDDFASDLKNPDIQIQLNKMLIKSRHACCSFIFTLQSYFYMPKMLRKQISYITLYKTGNTDEFISVAKELLNMKFDDALQVFNYVFDKDYNHLDIDTKTNTLYKNFNLLILEK